MRLARIIGHVVSTVKDERHRGFKLLLAQPVDVDGGALGPAFVAIDGAQAGVGDYVLICGEGKSARQVMGHPSAPCEAIAVGVIDHLTQDGRTRALEPPAAAAATAGRKKSKRKGKGA